MTTVGNLKDRVSALLDRLTVLRSNIVASFADTSDLKQTTVSKAKQQMRTLAQEKAVADAEFREEESLSQAMGGKSRKQTLQEFVLLFFFVAYGILTISLTLTTFRSEGGSSALKMFGLMTLMSLVVAAFILRMG